MKTLRILWRLTRGYRLSPWRSPYLRWRLETYWGLHADRVGFVEFFTFAWRHWRELWGYLRWAARMEKRFS
ncbi:MAG TPA: hypothetical protein VN442_20435 [Bryobacteraceae bacterium]|nr:hypothetical protein [Bryobacteraceae bacterium]